MIGGAGIPPPRRLPAAARLLLSVVLAGLALLLVLGTASLAAPADLPPLIIYNPAVAETIAQITTQTLAYELAGLTGERPVLVSGVPYTIATRHSFETQAISMATAYAYEQLASYGLSVTYHNYTYSGRALRNVVAEKPGWLEPDVIYLLTAHLDDMPPGPRAPGADDNGSGSVAVLRAADLLADHDLAYTVRFVLFTGEEQGLRGSAAYAAHCADQGEDIRGVVNLDMIAYNSDGQPVVELHASSSVTPSIELTRLFSEAIAVYGLELIPGQIVDGWAINRSDQWSFLQRGYPAILAIEDRNDFTPYYHTVTDTLATLDLDYYADFTRATVATFAHLGRLGEGVLSGTVRAADTGEPLSATLTVAAPALAYTATAQVDAGGAYSLLVLADYYTLTVQPLVPGYYPALVSDVLVVSATFTEQDVLVWPWQQLRHWYLPFICLEG